MKIDIYVNNYFSRTVDWPALPTINSRLVFKDDPYKGYIVNSVEFSERQTNELEIKLKCREDK